MNLAAAGLTQLAAWANLAILILSMLGYTWAYIRSVRPAQLALEIGPSAYRVSGRYRLISMVLMLVAAGCFILYRFLPLPLPLPLVFPWPWLVSGLLGLALAVPASYLVVRGVLDAGGEALQPREEQVLFGGIYHQVRHPQAWEAAYWFVLALWLNSPFLLMVALLGAVLEYAMVKAEERDLIVRFGKAYDDYRRRTPAFFPRRRSREG